MGIVENLFKQGKISYDTIDVIQDETFCETFGWTPDVLDSVDLERLDGFASVLKGREKGMADKMKKPK